MSTVERGASPPGDRGEVGTAPQAGEAVSIPRLEIVVEREGGQVASRSLVVDGELCRIGSHEGNDVVLADRLVSRFHCHLGRSASGWRLTDSGSLNGTVLGGIRARDADLPLPECRIALGDSVVRVRELGFGAEEHVPVWPSFGAIYGSSVPMRRLYGLLEKIAQSSSNVLVEGESGTGKELVASELVQRGPRAEKPFLVVDCGTISPSLIESELFGHTRGSFTGADRDRVGAFLEADGGTLFLDEIGELPLEMQPKLLRALEAREVRRVGENRPRRVDVRVLAATNRSLEREINHGRFRADLYFRLSVVSVRVPPLRERLEDLPMLVDLFLEQMKATHKSVFFSPEVIADMRKHDWPGNVRELRNYVERVVVLDRAHLGAQVQSVPSRSMAGASPLEIDLSFAAAKEHVVAEFEKKFLTMLLTWAGGNVTRAARKAGMDRMYLHRLLQRHDLHRVSFKAAPSPPTPPGVRR